MRTPDYDDAFVFIPPAAAQAAMTQCGDTYGDGYHLGQVLYSWDQGHYDEKVGEVLSRISAHGITIHVWAGGSQVFVGDMRPSALWEQRPASLKDTQAQGYANRFKTFQHYAYVNAFIGAKR